MKNKVHSLEVVIKRADKGDLTTIMTPQYYHRICMRELEKERFYENIGNVDQGEVVLNVVKAFAEKIKHVLTHNEVNYLTKRKYRTAYFYMLPKLHKSEYLNNILSQSETKYVNIPDFSEIIDGRPIVGGPAYQTSGISEMIDILLTPVMKYVEYLLKESFDFLESIERDREGSNETLFVTCDIKSLYTNISRNLGLKAMDYWITSTWDFIDPDNRFQKPFLLEALMIVLAYNIFYYCGLYWNRYQDMQLGQNVLSNVRI